MYAAPSIFISHGSPMFALEPGILGPTLARLGQDLGAIAAFLVVSPHWQTTGVQVMTTAQPATMHDFGGFPDALYRLQYQPKGHPALAAAAARLLEAAGFSVSLEEHRGLDHGAWVPLRHLRSTADIPVFQVSMPVDLNSASALRLGATLAPLREQGVAIVGSGSLTHNLYEFRRDVVDPDYAQTFVDWVRNAVEGNDVAALLAYRDSAPHARRAHPTEEHFLPLLVALGAGKGAPVQWLEGGMSDQILSMDSFVLGNRNIGNPATFAQRK